MATPSSSPSAAIPDPAPCLTGRARFDAALLTVALAFGWLARLAAPGVTFEDAGALATAAVRLGVPHPPGYPLWTGLGWLSVQLGGLVGLAPGAALSLFSSAAAALACGALAAIVRSRGAGLVLSCAAGLLPLASATFASQGVVIEVYALACAAQSIVLALALAPIARPRATWAALGLAAAAHPASLALLPAALAATLRARAWGPRALLGQGACLVAGLGVYVLVPLMALRRAAPDWGRIDSLQRLGDHLLRAQYRTGLERNVPEQLAFLGEQSLLQLPWALAGGLLASLLLVRQRSARFGLAVVAATSTFAALLLFASINWPLSEAASRVRLGPSYLPLVLCLCAWAGLGAAALAHWGRDCWGPRGALLGLAIPLLGLAPAPTSALINARDQSDATAAMTWARAALRAVPQNGWLVVNRLGHTDVLGFPLLYAMEVEGLRPDVLLIDRGRLPLDWYREQLIERDPVNATTWQQLGAALDAAPRDPRSQRLASAPLFAAVLEAGRPIAFTDPPGERLDPGSRLRPVGALWIAGTPAATPAPLPEDWLEGEPESPWVELHRQLERQRDAAR